MTVFASYVVLSICIHEASDSDSGAQMRVIPLVTISLANISYSFSPFATGNNTDVIK